MAPLKDQDSIGRLGGLDAAVTACLAELTILYGDEAGWQLKALRDKIIDKFKQSEIPAEFDMHHAEVNRSAIEAIELAFAGFFVEDRNLDSDRDT